MSLVKSRGFSQGPLSRKDSNIMDLMNNPQPLLWPCLWTFDQSDETLFLKKILSHLDFRAHHWLLKADPNYIFSLHRKWTISAWDFINLLFLTNKKFEKILFDNLNYCAQAKETFCILIFNGETNQTFWWSLKAKNYKLSYLKLIGSCDFKKISIFPEMYSDGKYFTLSGVIK